MPTTTSEIITSKSHIDPLRDDGYVIYKIGYIHPVSGGRREVSTIWGNHRPPVQIDNSCMFSFKFEVAEAFTFVCPEALKFTSMEHQQVNIPTLSVALNTNLAKYDNLVITPDAVGLVILKGTFL